MKQDKIIWFLAIVCICLAIMCIFYATKAKRLELENNELLQLSIDECNLANSLIDLVNTQTEYLQIPGKVTKLSCDILGRS